MSEVDINYKNAKIAGMDASGTKTLSTEGKYCEDDIKVVYTKPSGSVTAPSSISGTGATLSADTTNNLLTLSKTVSVTPSVTTPGFINSGTAGNSAVSLSAPVTIKDSQSIPVSLTAQEIPAGTYLKGKQTILPVVVTGLNAAYIVEDHYIQIGDSERAARIDSVRGSFHGLYNTVMVTASYSSGATSITFSNVVGEPTRIVLITSSAGTSIAAPSSGYYYYIIGGVGTLDSFTARYVRITNAKATTIYTSASDAVTSSYDAEAKTLTVHTSSAKTAAPGVFFDGKMALIYTYKA